MALERRARAPSNACTRDTTANVRRMPFRVGGRANRVEGGGATSAEAVGGADLGGSNKHSSEILEDQSGKGSTRMPINCGVAAPEGGGERPRNSGDGEFDWVRVHATPA